MERERMDEGEMRMRKIIRRVMFMEKELRI